MKYYCDGIIVVEGKNDASYLSSIIDGLYVITNGNEIPDGEIDFLNHLKNKTIIVLTDSDEAGKRIRNRLNDVVKNCENVEIDISKCNKHNKHGIAECEKEEIIQSLNKYLMKENKNSTNVLSLMDLINCGVITKNDREHLANELHLGNCNNKTLLKRINYKNISIKEIKEVMEASHGN